MEQEEFENRLRGSPHFRQSFGELFHSLEQAIALVAAATAEQLDKTRLEACIVRLQSEATADSPDAARDHILNEVRRRLRAGP